MKIMKNDDYLLISPEKEIIEFIENNKNTQIILDTIRPELHRYFPDSKFSLEICDKLKWTTETKLLVNVDVSEEIFFNVTLDYFSEIYALIDPLIEDIFCPIVLFPHLNNENYERYDYNCAINLIARTAYFNSDFDKNMQREMSLREIPKSQQEKEIIEYCKMHSDVDLSDLVFNLQLDLFDVDDILDELSEKGINLNVKY